MDLKKFLLPSRSVEVAITTIGEDQKPTITRLKTVIETGYENGFFKIITPVLHGRLYNFRVDDDITITFTTQAEQSSDQAADKKVEQKKDAFDIKCRVVSRDQKKGMYTITLKVTSSPQKVQRRQAFRVNIFNTYSFKYMDKNCEIVSKDISSTGMRGLTTMQMSKNDEFTIMFNANTKDKSDVDPDTYSMRVFPIRCRVIDCMPQSEIRRYMQRIQFLDLTHQQSKFVIQYLYAKQSEIIFTEGSDSSQREKMDELFNSLNSRYGVDDDETRLIQLLGLINLFVFFLAFVLFFFAQPQSVYGVDRYYNYFKSQLWNANYFMLSLISTLLGIGIGIYGLIKNAQKMKTDPIPFSRLLIATISFHIILFLVLAYFLATAEIFTAA